MSTTSLTLLDRLRVPGRADAWERFVSLYAPLLLEWARLQGFQPADAEDLAQTVLVKLIRLLPTYRRGDGESFRGWLFAVCRNECRAFRDRRATRPLPGDAGLETVAASAADPDDAEYRRHLMGRALELVRADFSADVWSAFVGVALDGRSATDVARGLGMTANAVYQARYRVLHRLRDELGGLLD